MVQLLLDTAFYSNYFYVISIVSSHWLAICYLLFIFANNFIMLFRTKKNSSIPLHTSSVCQELICDNTVEPQYNKTHKSRTLVANATKAIVARAIVTKKETHLFNFSFSMGSV